MRYALLTALLVIAGCSSGPTIRTDQDPSANFNAYRTYNFVNDVGTDRAGYSTLVTTHFKRAISREMESRGYRLDASNPDLLVNFFTSMKDRVETRPAPDMMLGTGYYNSRLGVYTAWPLYRRNTETTTYQVGTASIDVVDAARKQLVWEGVAEGRLSEDTLANPGPSIDSAVKEIFAKYPASAGAGVQ